MSDDDFGCYTLKGSLRSLIRCCEDDVQQRITEASCNVTSLMTRASFLIKLYVLDHFRRGEPIPRITYDLARHALKVVGGQQLRQREQHNEQQAEQQNEQEGQQSGETDKKRKRNAQAEVARDSLTTFYESQFNELRPQGDTFPSYEYLGAVLGYAAREYVTNVETIIKQHYVNYVRAHVKTCLRDNEHLIVMSEIANVKLLTNKIVHDLLTLDEEEEREAPPILNDWIEECRRFVLPSKDHFEKNSVMYDLKCDPQSYLLPMLRMAYQQEQNGGRLKNVLPLYTSAVPMHITIDTITLVRMFYDLERTDSTKVFDDLHMAKTALSRSAAEYNDEIWAALFRTGRKIFGQPRDKPHIFRDTKDYVFNHTIKTDGVSCCVLHRRRGSRKRARKKRRSSTTKDLYIDETDVSQYTDRDVVGIDPNMGNLLFCSMEKKECDEHGNTVAIHNTQFRYTQNQRHHELRVGRYTQIMLAKKSKTVVDGKSIESWESELGEVNFKTMSYDAFREGIRRKLLACAKVSGFYREHFFRKSRLNAYFNKKASERKMIAAVKEQFGGPEHTLIAIGDWAQKEHRKFKPPTKTKARLPRVRVPYKHDVLSMPTGRRQVYPVQEAQRAYSPRVPTVLHQGPQKEEQTQRTTNLY